MKKLLIACIFQFTLPLASAVQAFPITMQRPTSEGSKVVEIRIDAQNIYLQTNTGELIRIDKLALLKGNVKAGTLTLEQWTAIKKPAPSLEPTNQDSDKTTWLFGYQTVLVQHAYCGEGEDKWHALKIDGLDVDTGMDNCMTLFDPLRFNGKLWFRTKEPSYTDRKGIGILVFDAVKKRRVGRIAKDLAGGDSGLMLVDADLNGVWVVNDLAIHFFNRALKGKPLVYYSEQFDPDVKNWSVTLLSKNRRNHNQFAAAARIIMTPPPWSPWPDKAYLERLAQQRSVTAAGIPDYVKAVEQLSPRIRSNFWMEYNHFERMHFPFWGLKPMTEENGGAQFKAASRLLSCLYEKAGSPDSNPRDLVMNIALVAQGMSWAEFQLYEPKCNKQPTAP
jgi:hypothetical protein